MIIAAGDDLIRGYTHQFTLLVDHGQLAVVVFYHESEGVPDGLVLADAEGFVTIRDEAFDGEKHTYILLKD